MKRDENEGRSVIKGSGFLHVDWGDEKNGSVLFFQGNTVLFGINLIPFALYTTVKFDKNLLSKEDIENLYRLEKLFLSGDNNTRRAIDHGAYKIPLWINEITDLSFLNLNYFDLSGLADLKLKHLRTLVMRNAYISDIDTILVELLTYDNLSEIGYDSSCEELIDQLKKHCSREIEFIFLDGSSKILR